MYYIYVLVVFMVIFGAYVIGFLCGRHYQDKYIVKKASKNPIYTMNDDGDVISIQKLKYGTIEMGFH